MELQENNDGIKIPEFRHYFIFCCWAYCNK
jgi:hypothetical protein